MFKQKPLSSFLLLLTSIGFFVALFPWFFSYQGTLLGHKVSIRSVGDVLGALLILVGLATIVLRRESDVLQRLAVQLETLDQKAFIRLCVGLTFVFGLGAISHKLRAHMMLSTHAYDLGFFSNICWNTAQGDWFFSSLLERNFLGVHANWILLPLSFFYRMGADARSLLIAQVVFMTAAVPMLGVVIRRVTDSVRVALLISLMFVCSPYFLHSLFNDFHPDSWQIPFLTAALWAYHARRPYYVILFSIAAIFAKEDVSVVVCGFSLFLLLQPRWRFTAGLLMVVSLAIFFINVGVVTPMFLDSHGTLLLHRYPFGNSFKEVVLNLFTHPMLFLQTLAHDPMKYARLLSYVFPAAGLTLFAPAYLIPCMVSVLPHLLSVASTQLSLADIYAMPSQSFIFVGAAAGFANLARKDWFVKNQFALMGVCFIVAGWGVLNSPRTFRLTSHDRIAAFREIRETVPPNASLATQQNLIPHFDTRRTIQIFPIGPSMPPLQKQYLLNPDYILCDRIGNALPYDGEQLRTAIDELERNTAYEKLLEKEKFLLFRRRNTETPHWQIPL